MKQANSAQSRLEASWKAMAELAAESQRTYPEGWGTSPRRAPTPAKAYKPTHGGYPDAKPPQQLSEAAMTHDGPRLITIPMARWHQAANDPAWAGPLRAA